MAAGRGLAAAHDTGLVHRDFKPENVMLGTDGRVRVMDFGLARGDEVASGEDSIELDAMELPVERLTMTGVLIGTPAYMALEQFQGGMVDARSDQFGFCVTLYEALYGERPFEGETMGPLVKALVDEELEPPPRGTRVPTWPARRRQPRAGEGPQRTLCLDARATRGARGRPRRATAAVGDARGDRARAGRECDRARHAGLDGRGAGGPARRQGEEARGAKRRAHRAAGPGHERAPQAAGTPRLDARSNRREPSSQRCGWRSRPYTASTPSSPSPCSRGLAGAVMSVEAGLALKGHEDKVHAVAVHPDGSQIATASSDATVRLWDASSGALQRTLEGHEEAVHAVVFSRDGSLLATASEDETARVWDVATGKERSVLGHETAVRGVALSPYADRVATAGSDGSMRVWDLAKVEEVFAVRHDASVQAVAWSPNGEQLVTASLDGTAKVWDASDGAEVTSFAGHLGMKIHAAAWSPDGTRIVSGAEDGFARLWDAASGQEVAAFEHGESVHAVAFSSDGTYLASGTFDDGAAHLWEIESAGLVRSFRHGDPVMGVAWSPDGTKLATASWDWTGRSWEIPLEPGAAGARRTPAGGRRRRHFERRIADRNRERGRHGTALGCQDRSRRRGAHRAHARRERRWPSPPLATCSRRRAGTGPRAPVGRRVGSVSSHARRARRACARGRILVRRFAARDGQRGRDGAALGRHDRRAEVDPGPRQSA